MVDNSVSCAGVLRCSAYAIGRWFPVRPPDSGTNVDSDSRHGTFRLCSHKCILSWLARLNEVQLDSGVLTPQEHRLAGHFWAIIQD